MNGNIPSGIEYSFPINILRNNAQSEINTEDGLALLKLKESYNTSVFLPKKWKMKIIYVT